jgi:hypothetical protein
VPDDARWLAGVCFWVTTIHWNYMPALEGERSEMAHRTATSELFQAGHFHDQAQIVAVFAGWLSFATPFSTIRAEAGDKRGKPALESLY